MDLHKCLITKRIYIICVYIFEIVFISNILVCHTNIYTQKKKNKNKKKHLCIKVFQLFYFTLFHKLGLIKEKLAHSVSFLFFNAQSIHGFTLCVDNNILKKVSWKLMLAIWFLGTLILQILMALIDAHSKCYSLRFVSSPNASICYKRSHMFALLFFSYNLSIIIIT